MVPVLPWKDVCAHLFLGAELPQDHGTHVGTQNAQTITCLLPACLSCIASGLDNKSRQYQSKEKKL